MKIQTIEALPIRIPRDVDRTTGTAGLPSHLEETDWDYRWSAAFPTLYAVHFEIALVKITTDTGLVGWGEAQAPLAPQVACTIIDTLLRPVLIGAEFTGSREAIEALWQRMYDSMRVRGQTGGFMLDAIAGVDIALWDLAGQAAGKPVAELIAPGAARGALPAYISGLSGSTNEERINAAREYVDQGFVAFKIFYDRGEAELFDLLSGLRSALGPGIGLAVDALWRLDPDEAAGFGQRLDELPALWLECPLKLEDPLAHARLAKAIRTRIALGESYRTRYEMAPFFREQVIGVLQPDLGRSGITESLRLAALAAEQGAATVPHVSIAMGPQVAAALHFAAAVEKCPLVEYNPRVLEIANRCLVNPIELTAGAYHVPTAPGLGAEVIEEEVRRFAIAP